MSAPGVEQLAALSFLFKRALQRVHPKSVAILGIAGGNGLEHLDDSVSRVVGIDIRADYLDEVRRRFPALPLELHAVDLAHDTVRAAPVELVHAALIFEHAGLERAFDNALALVAPGGSLSVVLQLPSTAATVTPSAFSSMQALGDHVSLIAFDGFRELVESRGLDPVIEEAMGIPGGKSFWLGVFSR